jgi:hypothetical protein
MLHVCMFAAAVERLDNEQTRVQGLEDIVGQLEARLQELSQLSLSAPSAGAPASNGALLDRVNRYLDLYVLVDTLRCSRHNLQCGGTAAVIVDALLYWH